MAGNTNRRLRTCAEAEWHDPVEERSYRPEQVMWCEGCWQWVFVEPLRNKIPRRPDGAPVYPDVLSRRYR